MNGHLGPTPVPSGLTDFVLSDGRRFALDLVETARQLNKISKDTEGAQQGEQFEALIAWVLQKTGVTLNLSQADWFWSYVIMERERARADFIRELQSLSSTTSTPVDSVLAS